jgi:hypothetical protein
LLHKLQRKYAIRTDSQSNDGTASVENTTTNMYFLAVWDAKDHHYKFNACLIECINNFAWDEDKLWTLYKEYNDKFREDYNYGTITWLMHGNVVMKTRLEVTYGTDYKIDIVISEGTESHDKKEPVKIDPKRLVLPLSMLLVLIYVVSLHIRSSFKLNIRNQCLDVDLVSPTYITGNELECHRVPDRKVGSDDLMSSGFIINRPGSESDGALIYKLQRKKTRESTEIDEDASSSVYLLTIWRISGPKQLYADVLLIEHDRGFAWNKDNLRKLYHENFGRFRSCSGSIEETWLSDNNTVLKTKFELMSEDCTLNISVSEEERDNGARIPAHIDLKR